ncbi:hypothetical protein ACPDME_003166 [Vibrio cholerae]
MWDQLSPIKCECCICDAIAMVNIELFSVECLGKVERNMGEEVLYRLACELDCVGCGSYISLSFLVYEYPENVINYVDNISTGVKTS